MINIIMIIMMISLMMMIIKVLSIITITIIITTTTICWNDDQVLEVMGRVLSHVSDNPPPLRLVDPVIDMSAIIFI